MTVRGRSRRHPLTEFASRSLLHAFAVVLNTTIILAMGILTYLVVTEILVPAYAATQLVHQVQNATQ